MQPYQELVRQLRISVTLIFIIIPIGVIGYMLLEGEDLLDAIWITVTTLSTIGYGDVVPESTGGRIFTLLLVVIGLAAFAFAGQATLGFIFSPEIIEQRRRRQTVRRIATLNNHYILTGEGQLVDKTIDYLLQRVRTRQLNQREFAIQTLNSRLDRVFIIKRIGIIRKIARRITLHRHQSETLLDIIVVVTQDPQYVRQLREQGLLALQGDSTDESTLMTAGIDRAQALMAMSYSDTETLLTVMTADNHNPGIFITATTLDRIYEQKMLRVGANNIVAPFDVAGQFLNNATFRPAVHAFFNSILFDQERSNPQVVQLFLYDDSHWIGQRLGDLDLYRQFEAAVLAVRQIDGGFVYAPEDDYILDEEEIVLAIAPPRHIAALKGSSRVGTPNKPHPIIWQRIPYPEQILRAAPIHSREEAVATIGRLERHYIICDGGIVAREAIDKLDPARAFVIISDDDTRTDELLERGFRVVHGSPTKESVLREAGIEHALAIMIPIEDKANAVLAVLASRAMSKRVLVTATAETDDMIAKLSRAGADRVISPFRIAAQFVLMGTTRPVVSDFMQFVLFNRQTGLETTEIYMMDDATWINRRIDQLGFQRELGARVVGIRKADGSFVYAPPGSFTISEMDVLIITTPMNHADRLRELAHGSTSKRPSTIRL